MVSQFNHPKFPEVVRLSNLPQNIRAKLDVHAYRSNKNSDDGTRVILSPNQLKVKPLFVHASFRAHSETGAKSICAFPGIVQKIEDMADEETISELNALFEHCMDEIYWLVHCCRS